MTLPLQRPYYGFLLNLLLTAAATAVLAAIAVIALLMIENIAFMFIGFLLCSPITALLIALAAVTSVFLFANWMNPCGHFANSHKKSSGFFDLNFSSQDRYDSLTKETFSARENASDGYNLHEPSESRPLGSGNQQRNSSANQ